MPHTLFSKPHPWMDQNEQAWYIAWMVLVRNLLTGRLLLNAPTVWLRAEDLAVANLVARRLERAFDPEGAPLTPALANASGRARDRLRRAVLDFEKACQAFGASEKEPSLYERMAPAIEQCQEILNSVELGKFLAAHPDITDEELTDHVFPPGTQNPFINPYPRRRYTYPPTPNPEILPDPEPTPETTPTAPIPPILSVPSTTRTVTLDSTPAPAPAPAPSVPTPAPTATLSPAPSSTSSTPSISSISSKTSPYTLTARTASQKESSPRNPSTLPPPPI